MANTVLVDGNVVLNGTTRRLVSLFFDGWGVRAVSLLCHGLGTVRINHPLEERVTRAQITSQCDNKLYTYTAQMHRLWKIPFRNPQDNWRGSAPAGRRGHVT